MLISITFSYTGISIFFFFLYHVKNNTVLYITILTLRNLERPRRRCYLGVSIFEHYIDIESV